MKFSSILIPHTILCDKLNDYFRDNIKIWLKMHRSYIINEFRQI
jgi:hypothetical protein